MIYGNLTSLTIYTIIVLITGIITASPILLLISFINILLLVYQYDKQQKEEQKRKLKEQKLKKIERQKDIKQNQINNIKQQAINNIEEKYENQELSTEQKKDLIRQEFICLMKERD